MLNFFDIMLFLRQNCILYLEIFLPHFFFTQNISGHAIFLGKKESDLKGVQSQLGSHFFVLIRMTSFSKIVGALGPSLKQPSFTAF